MENAVPRRISAPNEKKKCRETAEIIPHEEIS
jgi:hypothetical protein